MSDESKKGLRCSFCGKHESQVHRMIQGPGVRICDECVQLCMSILNDGFEDTSSSALEDLPDQLPTPREIKDVLDQYVIGQDEAVSAVAAAVRRNRVGISPKHKPVSFIFVGPTGVGKTELSKALSEAMFGTENALIRVDMSEYLEKHSVSKMIGSPPGYVGYDEGGQLSDCLLYTSPSPRD